MTNRDQNTKRGLGENFLGDLKKGLLHPLLSLVKSDNTLMLAIRDNYINIYYRGGNLLKLSSPNDDKQYKASFDWKYASEKNWPPEMKDSVFGGNEIKNLKNTLSVQGSGEAIIETADKLKLWLTAFPQLKQIMDIWLTKNSKNEREFQQLVVRENNFSGLANQTDYFIVDIEAAYPGARFDILAAKWPATQQARKKDQLNLAFIEMKYGEKSLEGDAGLLKHLRDFEKFMQDEKLSILRKTVTEQIKQLNDLGLLKHTRTENRDFEFEENAKPEVIMLLASYPPQSQRLKNLFKDEKEELERFANHEQFSLRFYIPHSAGYSLFCNDMFDLEHFQKHWQL